MGEELLLSLLTTREFTTVSGKRGSDRRQRAKESEPIVISTLTVLRYRQGKGKLRDTQWRFSHYRQLVRRLWKATSVEYHPEKSRGSLLKYIESPNNEDWLSKSLLHNLANLFHL